MELEQRMEKEVASVKSILKATGELIPMLVVSSNKEVLMFPLIGQDWKKACHELMGKIKKADFEYAVFFAEAWMKIMKPEEKYASGDMQKSAEAGDKSILEVVIIQVYDGKRKMMTRFRKEGKELSDRQDTYDFHGYLDFEGDEDSQRIQD